MWIDYVNEFKPLTEDMHKLLHVLGYVKMCINDVLELDASTFYDIDASYATNSDYKSQF